MSTTEIIKIITHYLAKDQSTSVNFVRDFIPSVDVKFQFFFIEYLVFFLHKKSLQNLLEPTQYVTSPFILFRDTNFQICNLVLYYLLTYNKQHEKINIIKLKF